MWEQTPHYSPKEEIRERQSGLNTIFIFFYFLMFCVYILFWMVVIVVCIRWCRVLLGDTGVQTELVERRLLGAKVEQMSLIWWVEDLRR